MSDSESFGRRAAALSTPTSLVELEASQERPALFADVDALVSEVAVRALKGEATLKVEVGRHADALSIVGLDNRRQAALIDLFSVASQHSKGAWFLPDKASVKAGWITLASTFASYPRFATGLAWEERARVLLADNPAAVFAWAVLEPMFEQLLLPFELCGRLAGTQSAEDQLADWASVDELVSSLALDVANELAIMRYGGGWSRLCSAERLAAKQRLLAALASQATEQIAPRYRAYRLLPLIARYYRKAKNGQARRKQVLTRALERTLVGFFAGDWLKLLRYLGEIPHPDEEIAVAIPEIKLFVGGTKSPAAVALELGVPAEEVQRALSTYWDTTGQQPADSVPPVDERVGTLRAFWHHFDEAHTRQASGMRSLWGFVEESRAVRIGWDGPAWYNARLYRELLPSGLVEEIERLWASIMLPRWPARIVSEVSPHALMAEAFGPTLAFWHGAALTAWFVCEGPMSRTDMAGLATYHQDHLAGLQRLDCPIDPCRFAELSEAEAHLGPAEPLPGKRSSVEVALGISLEVSMTTGFRRSGFERLRDIITRYRRAWAERYLEPYLRARWESELREVGRLHAQSIAENGKPPTPTQFAKHAAGVANHWFGGDLSALYAAIGERSPIHPVRVSLMSSDRLGFAKTVFDRLGGEPFERRVVVSDREEARVQAQEQERYRKLEWLAEGSLRFIQLEEALGRVPKANEFGASEFKYRSDVLSPEVEQAWQKYAVVIESSTTAGKS